MDHLFVEDVGAFRRKMASAKGVLKDIRDQLFRLADSPDPSPIREAPAFAYLLTGEEKYAQSYREILMPQFKVINFDGCTEQEAHTAMGHLHIQAARTARAVMYYDWTADSSAYNEREREWILKSFLNYAHYQPYPGGLGGSGNQSASCFVCVFTTGYLCGVKRGDAARGRYLYRRALSTVRSGAGGVARGGYGGEGSTYQFGIHAPAATRICDFYEKATGNKIFDRRCKPNGVSFRDILEITLRELTPGGSLFAWDNYGLQPADSASVAAYMSSRGGEDRWLKEMTSMLVPYLRRNILWGSDDPIWTALWWPEGLKELQRSDLRRTSWMVPTVGAALEDRLAGVQLFQMWDPSKPRAARWQGNPNSILFEAYESPLLNDGTRNHEGGPTFDHDNYYTLDGAPIRAKSKAHGHTDENAYKRGANFGQGTFDAHNVILVDIHKDENVGQDADSMTGGKGILFLTSSFMDVASADCTQYYPARFGITSITRTTTFVKPDYVITRDHITSAGPHRFTYRLHLRRELSVGEGRARTVSAEQVALNVVPLEEVEWEHYECAGYPTILEGKSERLDLSRSGDEVCITVLLAPEDLKSNGADVSGGWCLADASRPDALDPEADTSAMPTVNASYPWHFQGRAVEMRNAVLRRTLRIPTLNDGERVYLRLGRPGPSEGAEMASCELWVNGQKVEPLLPLGVLPVRFDITDAVAAGEEAFVAVRLTTDGYDGMVGRWMLYIAHAPTLSPTIREIGEGVVAVESERYRDVVILERDGKGYLDIEDWHTDAGRGFLRGEDTWSVFDATLVRRGERVLMQALYPCMAGSRGDCMSVEVGEPNSVELSLPDMDLCIKNHSVVEISCNRCSCEKTLILEGIEDTVIFLNGQAADVEQSGNVAEVRIPIIEPAEADADRMLAQLGDGGRDAKLDAIVQLSYVHDRDDVVEVLAGHLHDEDICMRVTALEALGRIRNERAVPVLIDALYDYYQEPNAAIGYCVEMMNEWRYRAEVIFSLMKHRDPRALPAFKECLEIGDRHPGKRCQRGALLEGIKLLEQGVGTLNRLDAVTNHGQNP